MTRSDPANHSDHSGGSSWLASGLGPESEHPPDWTVCESRGNGMDFSYAGLDIGMVQRTLCFVYHDRWLVLCIL